MRPQWSNQATRLRPSRAFPLHARSTIGPCRYSGVPSASRIDRRWLSQAQFEPGYQQSRFGRRVLFAGLFIGGIYFGYRYVKSQFTVDWPKEVKDNARAALWTDRKGDKDLSLRYWEEALKAARSVDLKTLGEHPYLVVSGIGVMLVEAYIQQGDVEKAKAVLATLANPEESLKMDPKEMTEHDVVRQICMLDRLAQLQEESGEYDLAETTYDEALTKAATFKIDEENVAIAFPSQPQTWVRSLLRDPKELEADPAALFANAARFLCRRGDDEKSVWAYSVAVATLFVTNPRLEDQERVCYLALILTEYAEILLRVFEEPEKPQPVSYEYDSAKKALAFSTQMSKKFPDCAECQVAGVAGRLGLGAFFERTGSKDEAIRYYEEAWNLAKQIGLDDSEASEEAKNGLERAKLMKESPSLPPPDQPFGAG